MADFKSKVIIENKSRHALTLKDSHRAYGYWDPGPPTNIEPGAKKEFKLKDSSGPAGSEGWVKYTTYDKVELYMYFTCPYHGNNEGKFTCTAGSGSTNPCGSFKLNWWGKSDGGDWKENTVPTGGNPCEFHFKIEDREG